MKQEHDPDWAHGWSRRIGRNLARLRKEGGLSARELSERCTALGYQVPRNTIANVESGRKREVSVQELAVLAAALGTSPLALVYDPAEASVEVLPGRVGRTADAASWFAGGALKPEGYDLGTWLSESLEQPIDPASAVINNLMAIAANEAVLLHYSNEVVRLQGQVADTKRADLLKGRRAMRSLADDPDSIARELSDAVRLVDNYAANLTEIQQELAAQGVPVPLSTMAEEVIRAAARKNEVTDDAP